MYSRKFTEAVENSRLSSGPITPNGIINLGRTPVSASTLRRWVRDGMIKKCGSFYTLTVEGYRNA